MIPQLARTAKTIDNLMVDDEWIAEEKLDGDRLLVVFEDETVSLLTRKGKEAMVKSVGKLKFTPIKGHKGTTVLDGELLPEGQFHVFDMPILGGVDLSGLTWEQRRAMMFKAERKVTQPGFYFVKAARSTYDKALLLDQVTVLEGEGLVFKRLDSPYKFGTRSNAWLKWKLYKTCSVIVTELNREGKPEAVTINLFDGHELSGCKIPYIHQVNYDIKVGDVIEVRYLGLSPDMRLIQPVFLKKRTDISPPECTKEQFYE